MSKELPKELFNLSISQLRQLAKEKGVAVSGTRKADIIFMLQEAGITDTEGVDFEVSIKPVEEEVKKEVPAKIQGSPDIKTGKIAIYSEKNKFSSDFGRIQKGFNIVGPAQRDFWLQFSDVREATPKEVAKYYGAN